MILNISGILIEVNKKDIKNMHLSVKPPDGNVYVSAPITMSDEAVERFIRTKMSWIKKQIAKFENQPRQTEREYVSGETLFVWGKQYFLQTTEGVKNSIVLSGNKLIFTIRKGSTVKNKETFIREWYREILKAEIAKILPKWEGITGLQASSWQTKYMTTKWGSCNTKTGKIWINLQLAKKSPECLEYVILHELLHLVERNHNENFILLMDKYMPMWREIRATLNGQTLDYMDKI